MSRIWKDYLVWATRTCPVAAGSVRYLRYTSKTSRSGPSFYARRCSVCPQSRRTWTSHDRCLGRSGRGIGGHGGRDIEVCVCQHDRRRHLDMIVLVIVIKAGHEVEAIVIADQIQLLGELFVVLFLVDEAGI